MPERGQRRLDQWLWFARLVKSRSLGARLCAAGAVAVNTVAVTKPNHAVRIGDLVLVPQGGFRRTLRVLGLGVRRGPAAEARELYAEEAAAVRLSDLSPQWLPLLTTRTMSARRSRRGISRTHAD